MFVWIYVGLSDSLNAEGGFTESGRKLVQAQEFWFILVITILYVARAYEGLEVLTYQFFRVVIPWFTVQKVPVEITTVRSSLSCTPNTLIET